MKTAKPTTTTNDQTSLFETPQELVKMLETKYDVLISDQINASTTRERNQIMNSLREVSLALNAMTVCGVKSKVGTNPQKYFTRFFERVA